MRLNPSEQMIYLADNLGWPSIRESDFDVIVVDDGAYVYWRVDADGNIVYASDNRGAITKGCYAEVERLLRHRNLPDREKWLRWVKGYGTTT